MASYFLLSFYLFFFLLFSFLLQILSLNLSHEFLKGEGGILTCFISQFRKLYFNVQSALISLPQLNVFLKLSLKGKFLCPVLGTYMLH